MSVIAVSTPFNIDLEFHIASFGKRLLAWFLDAVLQTLYVLAFYYTIWQAAPKGDGAGMVLTIFGVMVPLSMYHFLQELFWEGQSIGKKIAGIKVVDMKGNEPTISRYLLRALLRVIDFGFFVGVPAAITFAVTRYNQRIGDLAAGTLVIEKNAKADLTQTIYLEVEDQHEPKVFFPEVMRLSDRDLNGIRNLLSGKSNSDHEIYMIQIAYRIKEVLKIESNLDTRSFLEQLLRDYNYLTRK